MKAHSTGRRRCAPVLALVAGLVWVLCAGCQTCSLSQEDFQRQQRGETVDKETGDAVAVVGTFGYFAAFLGETLAAIFR